MKIHYIGCHAVLEYDECMLLTELGYEVHCNGAYRDPRGAYTLPRPGIPGMKFDQSFFDMTAIHPKTNLPPEMIDPYDLIIVMSGENEGVLINNWDRIKHKRVIWRSIGQSTSSTERLIGRMKKEGLEVVRYSPLESNIPEYAGADAMIRFYKDEQELYGWNGKHKRPFNLSQSLKSRSRFCHFDLIMSSIVGFTDALVYGTGNNDLGAFNGGEITYEKVKELMRDSRVFVYGGTWPAQYTLSFIEAAMIGIPIVAFSEKAVQDSGVEAFDFFEVPKIMRESGLSELVCEDPSQAREQIHKLILNDAYAEEISIKTRAMALKHFSKAVIAPQWKAYIERTI